MTLLLHPWVGQGCMLAVPQTHGGCPLPSSAASVGILEVDAAACWGGMLFQMVLLGALLITSAVITWGHRERTGTWTWSLRAENEEENWVELQAFVSMFC